MLCFTVPLQFDTVAGCVEVSNVVLKSYTVYTEVWDCVLLWVCLSAHVVCVCMLCLCVCVYICVHTQHCHRGSGQTGCVKVRPVQCWCGDVIILYMYHVKPLAA